jgi:hypothetical protein
MMTQPEIDLAGKKSKVTRTSSTRLRTARFEVDGRSYQAIEQNPEKPSRWGQMARHGHRVVQFRDVDSGKYVAVSVNGKVREY